MIKRPEDVCPLLKIHNSCCLGTVCLPDPTATWLGDGFIATGNQANLPECCPQTNQNSNLEETARSPTQNAQVNLGGERSHETVSH